jgi:hypothetical protein
MSTSRTAAPSVYCHASRREWGRAVVAEHLSDRTRYVFEHGGERTLMNGIKHLEEVDLPPEERESLAKKLLRHAAPQRSSAAAKRAKAPVAKATTGITFELQEERFRARFPDGFGGEKYVLEQRNAPDGHDGTDLDALISTARQLLSVERLDAAIARKSYEEVYNDALKVVAAALRLAFPKADEPTFSRMPEARHEPFARALRDLLYGTAAYGVRFNAFVKALGGKAVPWTIATLFSAAVHPDEHVLVKPLQSQRQARVLGSDTPAGSPSGAAYQKHLAVARMLRDRLVTAGHTPRDLFDVYVYQWRTLSLAAQRRAPEVAVD